MNFGLILLFAYAMLSPSPSKTLSVLSPSLSTNLLVPGCPPHSLPIFLCQAVAQRIYQFYTSMNGFFARPCPECNRCKPLNQNDCPGVKLSI